MGEYTPTSRAGRRSSFGDTVEVLQLWRLRLIGWFDTPTPSGSGLFKWNSSRRSSCWRSAGTCAFPCHRDVKELLHVTVRKREAQVLSDCHEDDLRFKLAPLIKPLLQSCNTSPTNVVGYRSMVQTAAA